MFTRMMTCTLKLEKKEEFLAEEEQIEHYYLETSNVFNIASGKAA